MRDPVLLTRVLRAGGLPSTREEPLLIACPTCVLRTALKAQIILTTVPHSSPVLFGKQPLSCCTKRGFSHSPAVLGANLLAWNTGGGRGVWVRALQTQRPPLSSH